MGMGLLFLILLPVLKLKEYKISEFPQIGEKVEYVIITSQNLVPSFWDLVKWKRKKGTYTVVKTVEWIEKNYPGCDLAQKIRNFLKEAYERWGIRYVLLGGGVEIIPVRYIRSKEYEGRYEIPTDMYYSSLSGNWNANNNEIWGEVEEDTVIGDSVSYDIHLYVGRVPFYTEEEIKSYVNKVINYEHGKVGEEKEYQNKLLLVAGKLNTLEDGVIKCREIGRSFPDYFVKDSLYTLYNTLSYETFVSHIKKDYSYVYVTIHGAPVQHWARDCRFNREAALKEEGGYFLVTVISCYSNYVEIPSIASNWLANPRGGCIGYRGNSRVGWATEGQILNRYFYSTLFHLAELDSSTQVGKVEAYAKRRFALEKLVYKERYNANRDTYFGYLYLGDPELELWTNTPRKLIVSHPTIVEGGDNFFITVKDEETQTPLKGAKVCISGGKNIYVTGVTNEEGKVVVTPPLEGQVLVDVVVTRHKYLPYEGKVLITIGKPYLILDQYFVKGKIEINTPIAFYLSLKNTGTMTASSVKVKVVPQEEGVEMIEGEKEYQNILPNRSKGGEFIFKINKKIPKEVKFYIYSQYTEGENMDSLTVNINFPSLEHFSHTIDKPSLPVREEIHFSFKLKNSSHDTVKNVLIKLNSLVPQVIIQDSTEIVSSLPPLSIIDKKNCFSFTINEEMEDSLWFIFTINLSQCVLLEDTFLLKIPPPPTSVSTSPGRNSVLICWQKGSVWYKYNVYEKGNSSPLNFFPISSPTLFSHENLSEWNLHHYYVTSIDEHLNESPPSLLIPGKPNPPFKKGWPQPNPNFLEYFYNGLAVGNITGDKKFEVIATGLNKIYAWKSDGRGVKQGEYVLKEKGEWTPPCIVDIDGDGLSDVLQVGSWADPTIYAIKGNGEYCKGFPIRLNESWSGFWAPAVNDIDGDGILEIVVKCGNHLYVFRQNGEGFLEEGGKFREMNKGVWDFNVPAVGDIDEDGKMEIIMTVPEGTVYVFTVEGKDKKGWPQPVKVNPNNQKLSVPTIGDVDKEYPGLEVVVHSSGCLYVFHHDGTLCWKKPGIIEGKAISPPALGDIDGDEELEIVLPTLNILYVWENDGTPKRKEDGKLFEEMRICMMNAPPIGGCCIADVDGDSVSEIILVSPNLGDIYAFKGNGELVNGFPIRLNGIAVGVPIVRDIDFNGKNEIIITTHHSDVRIWEVEGDKVEWCGYGHDRWHTGVYGFFPPEKVGVEEEEKISLKVVKLYQNVPNPMRNWTQIKYYIPKKGKVEFKIYDITGRIVVSFSTQKVSKGEHFIQWERKDKNGTPLPSGIYFYQLKFENQTITKKMVLL